MEIFSGFKSYPASVRAPMPRTRYHPSSSPIALAACCLANAIRQHNHVLVSVSQGQATLQYHSLISRCVCSRSGACSRASKDTSHAPVATRIAHVPLLARVTDWAPGLSSPVESAPHTRLRTSVLPWLRPGRWGAAPHWVSAAFNHFSTIVRVRGLISNPPLP